MELNTIIWIVAIVEIIVCVYLAPQMLFGKDKDIPYFFFLISFAALILSLVGLAICYVLGLPMKILAWAALGSCVVLALMLGIGNREK